MDMYDAIKGMIGTYLKSCDLANYRIGTVAKVTPLEIKISDRLPIDSEHLILTAAVVKKTIEIPGISSPVVINDDLCKDDKVLLLMVDSGQKYIVLSKVVE